jgi:hypothetical protein
MHLRESAASGLVDHGGAGDDLLFQLTQVLQLGVDRIDLAGEGVEFLLLGWFLGAAGFDGLALDFVHARHGGNALRLEGGDLFGDGFHRHSFRESVEVDHAFEAGRCSRSAGSQGLDGLGVEPNDRANASCT